MATKLLQKAFAEAGEKLPEFEQDALAEWLLQLISSDSEWDKAFSPPYKHESFAEQEISESRQRGELEPLDPDKL
jgi:hypothetical protein